MWIEIFEFRYLCEVPVLTTGEAGPDRFHDKQNVPEYISVYLTCVVISSNGGYVIVNITTIYYYAHLRLNRKLRQQLEKKIVGEW